MSARDSTAPAGMTMDDLCRRIFGHSLKEQLEALARLEDARREVERSLRRALIGRSEW